VGVDPDPVEAVGDADDEGETEDGAGDVGEGEDEGVGVDEGDRAGDGDGERVVGGGLGVIVAVTHGCAVAATSPTFVLPRVTAVVARTAPTMHKPVATAATTDPCLRTLTRLTPFLRSSVEGSLLTRYRHTIGYLRTVPRWLC
jgi:hypothetical protein